MHLPAHLRLIGSTYYYRQSLPRRLRQSLGKQEIQFSLRTKDPRKAKALAYAISARLVALPYMPKPTVEELLKAHERGELDKAYVLEMAGIKITADTQQDHQNVLEALKIIRQLELEHPLKPIEIAPQQAPQQAQQLLAEVQQLKPPAKGFMTLQEGVVQFLGEIEPDTHSDTQETKTQAIEEFRDWKGPNLPVQDVGRADCKNFKLHLQSKGNTKPTIKNKMTYLTQFLDNMQAAGVYPQGDNPATRQVRYSKREKDARSELFGSRAFTDEQIKTIFDPKNFLKQKNPHEIWIPLIQLFTGARVTEVAQLFVNDFVVVDGFKCIRILEEGETQSVKSTASKRTLPIHPTLLELKIWDFVKDMKAAGHESLFPYLFDGKNGKGDRQIKRFSYYLGQLKVKASGGRFGTHSFRKTVVQATQKCHEGISHAYTGHTFQTQRKPYQRPYTPKEMADELFSHLTWTLSPLLAYKPYQFDEAINDGILKLENSAKRSEREKARAKEKKKR